SDLRDGHVELAPEPVFQALHRMTLVLQGMRITQLEFERQYANRRHVEPESDKYFRRNPLRHKRLDHIIRLHVGEVPKGHAAFEATFHLAGIVLEPLQRLDLTRIDDYAIAQQAHFAVSRQHSVQHHAASHVADLGDPENVPDFG